MMPKENFKCLLFVFFNLASLSVIIFMAIIIWGLFVNGDQLLHEYSGKVIRVWGGVVVDGLLRYLLVAFLLSLPITLANYFVAASKYPSLIFKGLKWLSLIGTLAFLFAVIASFLLLKLA